MLELLRLRCEYAVNPLGVDVLQPRLSWVFGPCVERDQAQSAFQVQVASTLEGLIAGQADVWDSGKVASSMPQVEYGGRPLVSRQRCFWRARAWDADDAASAFSQPAWFEMGLLNVADWEARWIGNPAGWNGRAVYFRKVFELSKPVRQARIYASGLGYFELHLNGSKLGDAVLDPGVTDTTKRVLYNTFDVRDNLRAGANLVGAVVGNGWYGAPKLLLQLEIVYTDGSSECIATWKDWSSWQVCSGPVLENSIYGGETYDARLEKPGWDAPGLGGEAFDRLQAWQTAMAVEAPGGRLAAQMAEPIRVVQTLRPQKLTQPAPGVSVFDFGQNFAGWARLRVSGRSGERVTLKFAESLYADGTVNQENLRSAAALDTYILKGGAEETWEPAFTYHGFRYVQVEGLPGQADLDTLQGRVVRSAVEPRGAFESSSDLLNRINRMVRWTEESNLHSIPTDCPQRDERMGWMNDLAARSEEMIYNFDVSRFFNQVPSRYCRCAGPCHRLDPGYRAFSLGRASGRPGQRGLPVHGLAGLPASRRYAHSGGAFRRI
jgi:alpha-L-rhamnosidase